MVELDRETLIRAAAHGKQARVHIQVPRAEAYVRAGLKEYTGDYKWLPEYDEVVNWLRNNQGKGLLMYGNCGRGKTILGELIIPHVITYQHRKIVNRYSYRDLNTNLQSILTKKLIYIDDIGQETIGKSFGNEIHAFSDIVDVAEKEGKLLILTSNLRIDELRAKYGDRVMSRLRGMMKLVLFKGDDLRTYESTEQNEP